MIITAYKMDKNILKYIPKSKHTAIRECYKDCDGYWIILVENYIADRVDSNARVIHEDTIKDLRYQIGGIVKVGVEND